MDWCRFQSTPPRGRRLRKRDLWRMRGRYFNPLRREGGDVSPVKPSACGRVHFNPLRREGGDRISIPGVHLLAQFQSTPPRGRRQILCRFQPELFVISIHSAARAETPPTNSFLQNATYFNPLRREGGDKYPDHFPCSHVISIHSAARAETISSSTKST